MKTINLLPKTRQVELSYELSFHSLLTLFILSLLSFAAVFLVQFGVKIYLQAEDHSLAGQINELTAQVNKQENAGLKQQVQDINDKIADFNTLADTAPKWSRVLKAFASLPPAGVQIASFSVDPAAKTVTINGFSPSRDLVIQLYNNIQQDSRDFYNVDYPLDNLVKASNVNFHFTFSIKDQLMY
ncbi:MAG TPA: hypothetical protein VHA30_02245 [Patescibacteria group bacterium]|nr:hypothetical protein [Patescibacteria group bacterium]